MDNATGGWERWFLKTLAAEKIKTIRLKMKKNEDTKKSGKKGTRKRRHCIHGYSCVCVSKYSIDIIGL